MSCWKKWWIAAAMQATSFRISFSKTTDGNGSAHLPLDRPGRRALVYLHEWFSRRRQCHRNGGFHKSADAASGGDPGRNHEFYRRVERNRRRKNNWSGDGGRALHHDLHGILRDECGNYLEFSHLVLRNSEFLESRPDRRLAGSCSRLRQKQFLGHSLVL